MGLKITQPPSGSLFLRYTMRQLQIYCATHRLYQPWHLLVLLAIQPYSSSADTPNGITIPGLYLLPLSSEDDSYNHLFEAYSNRLVAEHQLNRRSSRSHVIYTYYITRTRITAASDGTDLDPEVVNSKLHLIDLAGGERVEKTGSVGSLQKEASHINRSLTFLEQVVIALTQSKRDHIPSRQSKLTYLLKDSL